MLLGLLDSKAGDSVLVAQAVWAVHACLAHAATRHALESQYQVMSLAGPEKEPQF